MAMDHVLYLVIAHFTLNFNHILSLLIDIGPLPLPLDVLIKQLVGSRHIVRGSRSSLLLKGRVVGVGIFIAVVAHHPELVEQLIMLLLFLLLLQPLFVERSDGL